MSLKERVEAAYQITQEATAVSKEELNRIETVLYVMADKFLESAEMDELMEVIGMTRLGQKLVNKGKEEGKKEGRAEGKEEGREEEKLEIAQNLIGLLDEKIIAERTKLPLETVLELKQKQKSISI